MNAAEGGFVFISEKCKLIFSADEFIIVGDKILFVIKKLLEKKSYCRVLRYVIL